jgi:hypothetical protein
MKHTVDVHLTIYDKLFRHSSNTRTKVITSVISEILMFVLLNGGI